MKLLIKNVMSNYSIFYCISEIETLKLRLRLPQITLIVLSRMLCPIIHCNGEIQVTELGSRSYPINLDVNERVKHAFLEMLCM